MKLNREESLFIIEIWSDILNLCWNPGCLFKLIKAVISDLIHICFSCRGLAYFSLSSIICCKICNIVLFYHITDNLGKGG